MPLQHYGVLKGRAIAARREDGANTPHYQVHIAADEAHYRIAVNVQSQSTPSELLFLVDDQFRHPISAQLGDLPQGWSPLPSQPGGVALDFIRGNLFNRLDMRRLPSSLPGPDNDLSDQLEHYIARAIREDQALVYAFGQRWGPETQADKIFGFRPGNGVHDIHMNQGNVPPFLGDDGVWQDGGLLIGFAAPEQWVAIFLAFQSQAWHTDDRTGHTTSDVPELGSDQSVRIVGALVNPIGPAPEHETVTLINTTPNTIDLSGWQIADRLKRKHTLSGTLAPGATTLVALPPTVQLGNRGGIISLLNQQGLKVDGVAYTQEQADKEGWTIVF
ncbi:MAG: DUF2278 family protein [Roseiflexaceae bacterium]